MTNTPQWREEFYKKFSYIQAIKNEASGNCYEKVADFIETQIAQARREWKEEMKNRCLEVIPEYLEVEKHIVDFKSWYNEWLEDARSEISSL